MASFDTITSLLDYLDSKGALEKDGARIVWDGGKFFKKTLAEKIRVAGEYSRLEDLIRGL